MDVWVIFGELKNHWDLALTVHLFLNLNRFIHGETPLALDRTRFYERTQTHSIPRIAVHWTPEGRLMTTWRRTVETVTTTSGPQWRRAFVAALCYAPVSATGLWLEAFVKLTSKVEM